jgi:hypothetical protein
MDSNNQHSPNGSDCDDKDSPRPPEPPEPPCKKQPGRDRKRPSQYITPAASNAKRTHLAMNVTLTPTSAQPPLGSISNATVSSKVRRRFNNRQIRPPRSNQHILNALVAMSGKENVAPRHTETEATTHFPNENDSTRVQLFRDIQECRPGQPGPSMVGEIQPPLQKEIDVHDALQIDNVPEAAQEDHLENLPSREQEAPDNVPEAAQEDYLKMLPPVNYAIALERINRELVEVKECLGLGHPAFINFSKPKPNGVEEFEFWRWNNRDHNFFCSVFVALHLFKELLTTRTTERLSSVLYQIVNRVFGEDISNIPEPGEEVNRGGVLRDIDVTIPEGLSARTPPRTKQGMKDTATRAVHKCSLLLDVPRVALGVRCAPTGFIRGNFSLEPNPNYKKELDLDYKKELDLGGPVEGPAWGSYKNAWGSYEYRSLQIDDYWLLPDCMRPFKIVPGDNATLVTVEKDCLLHKIAGMQVMDTYGLILATGKGFPPLALKSAVSQIQAMLKEPKKPVIHFGDCC